MSTDPNELHIPMRVPDLLTVRGQVLAGLVQILGDQHAITDRKTGLPGPGHPQAVTGCPWCVDDDRAALVDMTLRHLNPDEWSNLSAHTARWVCAVQDLIDAPETTAHEETP